LKINGTADVHLGKYGRTKMALDLSFYKGKRVLITGHTGFKGTWLTKVLVNAGANVIGYSRCSDKEMSLFEMSGIRDKICHIKGDIRDFESLKNVFDKYEPEIVFHLAAQPIVRDSYRMPVYTYETNVMGTVNLLECVRLHPNVKSVLNVTTDKVYQNNEWCWGYREIEPLDGFDPYSNSKSCSELVTHSFKSSFFDGKDVAISTARAGNVIGGGDFANDRIIPDCVRAMVAGKKIEVRNPYSVRPYQHVLEPLIVYLEIVEKQYKERSYQGHYNVGPDECDCLTTGELVDIFCECWGQGAAWVNIEEKCAPHEANFLKLDCGKLKKTFGWKPRWHMRVCMEMVCRFSKVWIEKGNLSEEMDREIDEFLCFNE